MNSEDAKRIFQDPNDKYNVDLNAIRQVVIDLMYEVHALHTRVEELEQKKGKKK